ncbi:MAG: antibiotic biosynthesis monooxygenase [Pseudomonadota bacterium]
MHFIFEVHIKPGYSAGQYADAWLRASEIIQQSPGAQGTRLHRKIGDPNVLLAIATWESKALRDEMELRHSAKVQDIITSQAEFVDIVLVGEFEAPEWEVIPSHLNPD